MTRSLFTFPSGARRLRSRTALATTLLSLFLLGMLLTLVGGATAAATAVSLGTADSFAILAGTPNITDVPTSVITGDVGLNPAAGGAIGLTCAEVTGTIYSVDGTGPLPCRVTDAALLTTAKTDLTAAYTNAAAEIPDTTFLAGDNQLGGQVLAPGVYNFSHATTANLIGNLTLSGDANAIWVFQATSDLVTASSSTITLTGGAQACNVYWEVGSSATLGTSSKFTGTIMALTDINVTTGVTLAGRVLARNGVVTLDADTITRSPCSTGSTTSTTTTTATTTTATTDDSTPTDTTPVVDATLGVTTATVASTGAIAPTPTPTPELTPKAKPRARATDATTTTQAAEPPVRATNRSLVTATLNAKVQAARLNAKVQAARAAAAKALVARRAAVRRADAAQLAEHRAARRAAARRAALARGHAEPALGNAGLTG